ncbi:MAG: hypothetical protein J7L15_06260 [Clostridiales bacterium]|nr:hypothetical protein [Clostridiales bacterium]
MANFNSQYTGQEIDAEISKSQEIMNGNDGNGNYWIKLPGGVMMQWGVTGDTAIASASANTVVAFPIEFPIACDNVNTTCSTRNSAIYTAYLGSGGVKLEFSVADFTVSSDASTTNAFGIYWQAFGRWE